MLRVWMVPCEVRVGIVALLISWPGSGGSAAICGQTKPALSACTPGFRGRACSLGWCPALGTLPAWSWQCPGAPAQHFQPSCALALGLLPGPHRPGLAGALRAWPGPAMASNPLRASCLELSPQVGLSCAPASFSQCLSMLFVFHSPVACMDFLYAPSLS